MNYLRRQAWISLLALLILIVPLTVLAQEDTVRLDGSRIVAGIVEPLVDTYTEANAVDASLEISGTNSGLARLCNGEIDIANAARPITEAEEQACADNDIEWVEVQLGYDVVALVTNPANTFAECLNFSQLSTLLVPSATGGITAWNQVNPDWSPDPFVLAAPPVDDTTYNLLDELLPGDGLRTDLATQDSAAAVISAMSEDPAGLGFAPLTAVLDAESELQLIALDDLSGAGCVTPTQGAVEDGDYPGARGLYFYVNAASLEREAVSGLVNAVLGEDGQAAIAGAGFLAPSSALLDEISSNVADGITGRAFSPSEPLYTIPLDVSGNVTAQTAAAAYQVLNTVTTAFSQDYGFTTVTTDALGNPAAFSRLCSGEAELGAVTRAATDEETALCEENSISLWELPLGHLATVMVVPTAAEFSACLTADQITALWQDQGEDTAMNWNDIDPDFPDLPITLFLPPDSQSKTDSILATASGQLLNPRRDALQTRSDALYRMAATANVEGAITYVNYTELAASDADIVPVAIDAGDGCVIPTLATINDGSYLLSIPVALVSTEQALASPEVQALVWYLLRDASRELLADADLILVEENVFEDYRTAVVEVFANADAAAAAAEAEAESQVEPTVDEPSTDETPSEEPAAAPTVDDTPQEETPEEPAPEATEANSD